MLRTFLVIPVLLAVPLLAHGQAKKNNKEPVTVVDLKRTTAVAYEKEIEPIFVKRCTACHSGSIKEADFDLSTYEKLMKGGRRGKSVVEGKGADSLLYKLIARTAKPMMPPPKDEDPCTPEEIALVKLWIDQGAKAPTGPSIREKPKVVLQAPPPTVTPVRAVAVSPDGKLVASGRGNRIHLYDAKGEFVRTLTAPGLKTPDGKEVSAAHLSLVESMAWSPDGKLLASGSFQEVSIWDPQSGERKHRLEGLAHVVVALAFSPDSSLFAAAGGEPTVEGQVRIFEVATWNPVTDITGHSDTVYGIAFSPDGKKIATASADKFVKTWELPSGKFLKSFEGHTHHVLDIGWLPDGKLLASAGADNTVKLWDFEKGEQVRTINAHGKQVTRLVVVGKKGDFLTASGDNQVKLFNAGSTTPTGKAFAGATDFIYAIAASGDGSLIAAGGQEGIVRIYSANAQLIRAALPPDAQPQKSK